MKITITVKDESGQSSRTFSDSDLDPTRAVDYTGQFMHLMAEEIARQAKHNGRSSRTIILRAEELEQGNE